MWTIFIFFLSGVVGYAGSLPERFIATECYGNVLSISCKAGHRIKVLDDFFGVSTWSAAGENSCQYQPGDCTVTNSRHTSVIHRYCEGRQVCNSFQVDRRFCGHNQTSYEQIEYKCVPDLEVTNMCTTTSYTARSGYIATPNFPNEYPPNLHCSCSIGVNQAGTRVQLQATHFIIKFDSPCQDWVEITMSGQKRRLCGAYKSTLFSDSFNLTFHSDDKHGHQGLWLHFSVYPKESNGTLLLTCAEVAMSTTATSTAIISGAATSVGTTSATSTTSSTSSTTTTSTTTNISPVGLVTSTGVVRIPQTMPTKQAPLEVIEFDSYPKDSGGRDVMLPESTTVILERRFPATKGKQEKAINRENEINPVWERRLERRWRDMLQSWFTTHRPPDWWTTRSASPSAVRERHWPNAEQENLHAGVAELPSQPTQSDTADLTEEEQRKNNRLTGIIIISICVGGILLLVVILSVLLCINKRKRPKLLHLERHQHNHRLQQRLNSLSFYDSIPLYDSMGRRAAGVTRAPHLMHEAQNPQPIAMIKMNQKPVVVAHEHQQPQQQQYREHSHGEWKSNASGNGPDWASLQLEAESDHDSAIYAELDKQSRGELSEGVDTPSTLPRRCDHPEMGNYAVQLGLQNEENDDIYTHV